MNLPNLLASLSKDFIAVIDPNIPKEAYVSIDLSTTNQELDVTLFEQPDKHHQQIQTYLKAHSAQVAYGGYLEQRKLYDRSTYFEAVDNSLRRNIHLGLDLWCVAETAVVCPLDAKVHSYNNNTNFGDYGPTIILEHQLGKEVFYSLYGHLSVASIKDIKVGQKLVAGEIFARLGSPAVNGEYAPHLHFQIIHDLQGMQGDYPGVARASQLEFYKNNCPDPNLLLKIY